MFGLKFTENQHGDWTATDAQTGFHLAVFENVGAPGEYMWMWTIRRPARGGEIVGELLASGQEWGRSDDSRREAMRQAKMVLESLAPKRTWGRSNPGTAQLEAAVAKWAAKQRRR